MATSESKATMAELTVTETNFKPHLKSYLIVTATSFIYFVQLMGVVGSGFLAQYIVKLFNGTADQVWLATIINIFTMAMNPAISEVANYWGRKWILVISNICGFIGCIVISRAQSMATVLVGYCIQSISYGCQALIITVISEVLPRKQRPKAMASANISAGLGAIMGLVTGGALVNDGNSQNYRIYFYVNAAIFAMSALIFLALYNPPPRDLQAASIRNKLAGLDWVGYALSSIGFTLLALGLSWAYNPYSWVSAYVLAPFILGVVIILIFISYEWRWKKDGLLHHSLFRQRNFPIAFTSIFIEGFIFFSCNNYFTFEVAVFTSSDVMGVALHFVVFFAISLVSAGLTGWFCSRKRMVRYPLSAAYTVLLVFCILMATSNHRTPAVTFWGFPLIAGVAFGMILPTTLAGGQLSASAEQISISSGLMLGFRGTGGVVSLAINNIIFNAAMANLPSNIAAATLRLGLPASSLGAFIAALTAHNQGALQKIKGLTPEIAQAGADALLDTYGRAFRNIWICSGCISFIGIIVCLSYKDISEQFSDHVDAPAEADPLFAQNSVDPEISHKRPISPGEQAVHQEHIGD